jgi:curved DNA-binding protein CbpA
VAGSDPEQGISWYDVLGVLAGASAETIQRTYEDKMSLLRPELISGAPSTVVKAASRAGEILDAARRVLGDPVSRTRYDETAGFRRSGGGLARPAAVSSDPGWGPADIDFASGLPRELVLTIMALTDWLTPRTLAREQGFPCRMSAGCSTACA